MTELIKHIKLRDYGAFGVYFDTASCQFALIYENVEASDRYSGDWFDTFEKAVAKADRMGKQKPVNINVRVMKVTTNHTDKLTFVRGAITGVHAGNSNWLVKWDDQKTAQQVASYGRSQIRRDLSQTEVERLSELYAASKQAQKDYSDYFDSLEVGDFSSRSGTDGQTVGGHGADWRVCPRERPNVDDADMRVVRRGVSAPTEQASSEALLWSQMCPTRRPA